MLTFLIINILKKFLFVHDKFFVKNTFDDKNVNIGYFPLLKFQLHFFDRYVIYKKLSNIDGINNLGQAIDKKTSLPHKKK